MPPKRQTGLEKFGRELRLAREAAGITGRELAKAINYSVGTISNWEQGNRCPDIKDVERIEKVLAEKGYRTNGYLVRYLNDWVYKTVSPEWSKWRQIEEHAFTLLSYEHSQIPGLLQTEDYTRTVLGHDRDSPLPLEERVRFRMERQEILNRENPPTTVFIFDECVLHHQVGSRKTMHEQITHLIDLAQRPDMIIQVVRQGSSSYAALSGSFTIAKLDGKEIAYQDGIIRGHILDNSRDVATLSKYWQHILSKALTEEETLELLRKEAEKWKP